GLAIVDVLLTACSSSPNDGSSNMGMIGVPAGGSGGVSSPGSNSGAPMMGANGTGQNTQPGTGGATTMGSGGSHAGTGGAMAPSATSGGGSGAAGNSPADGGTTDGMMPPGMSTEPKLPEAKGDCPDLSSGFVTINGSSVQTWTGMKQEKKAPLVIYWHVTGGSS